MANERSPLTPEQKKTLAVVSMHATRSSDPLQWERTPTFGFITKKRKELTPDHWDIIRRVHLQYSSFEGTSYTRQSFRSSDEKTFESVSKDNAIAIESE